MVKYHAASLKAIIEHPIEGNGIAEAERQENHPYFRMNTLKFPASRYSSDGSDDKSQRIHIKYFGGTLLGHPQTCTEHSNQHKH
jgi:hypothetical protein